MKLNPEEARKALAAVGQMHNLITAAVADPTNNGLRQEIEVLCRRLPYEGWLFCVKLDKLYEEEEDESEEERRNPEAKPVCEACQGEKVVMCSYCNGLGSRYPETSPAPICPYCKGKGEVRCVLCQPEESPC